MSGIDPECHTSFSKQCMPLVIDNLNAFETARETNLCYFKAYATGHGEMALQYLQYRQTVNLFFVHRLGNLWGSALESLQPESSKYDSITCQNGNTTAAFFCLMIAASVDI